MSANPTSLGAFDFAQYASHRPAVRAHAVALAAFLRRRRAGREFPAMLDLDERTLRDIGLTRHDAMELKGGGGQH